MSRKSRIGTGRPSALNCWGKVAQVLALPTINNSVLLFIIVYYPLFADWSRIELPVASFSEEEVKEVKGLVVSPYTSLQFLELELKNDKFSIKSSL